MRPFEVLNIQKGHFGLFKNVKNINMQKLKYCMHRKILILRVCHRGIVEVNLKVALGDESWQDCLAPMSPKLTEMSIYSL